MVVAYRRGMQGNPAGLTNYPRYTGASAVNMAPSTLSSLASGVGIGGGGPPISAQNPYSMAYLQANSIGDFVGNFYNPADKVSGWGAYSVYYNPISGQYHYNPMTGATGNTAYYSSGDPGNPASPSGGFGPAVSSGSPATGFSVGSPGNLGSQTTTSPDANLGPATDPMGPLGFNLGNAPPGQTLGDLAAALAALGSDLGFATTAPSSGQVGPDMGFFGAPSSGVVGPTSSDYGGSNDPGDPGP